MLSERARHVPALVAPCVLVIALVCGVPGRGAALDLRNILTGYTISGWSGGQGVRLGPVWALARTTDGYLWLGTDDGLVRFDGVGFTRYPPDGDNSLPSAPVRALHVDREGRLWIGFAAGEGIRVVRDGRVVSMADGPTWIRALTSDAAGTVWAGGAEGLFVFERGQWQQLGPEHGVPAGEVHTLSVDPRGDLWIGAGTTLQRRSRDRVHHTEVVEGFRRGVTHDAAGRVWVGTSRTGVERLEDRLIAGDRPGAGTVLTHDRAGNLWVGTAGQGLWRIQHQNVAAPRVEVATIELGILNNGVWSILEDDHGIWVGTNSGLNLLAPHRLTPITNLGIVRSVEAADARSLWVGTTEGLRRLDTSSAEVAGGTVQLRNTDVRLIHRDVRGRVWLATSRGFGRLIEGRFVPFEAARHVTTDVTAIESDATGQVWIADSKHGVFSLRDDRVIALPSATNEPLRDVTVLHADATGRLWVVADAGRRVVTASGDAVEPFGPANGPGCDPSVWGSINTVEETSRGDLWFATSAALVRFRDSRCAALSLRHGLPQEPFTTFAEDRQGALWTSTMVRLLRIDPATAEAALAGSTDKVHYAAFDEADGLGGVPRRFGQAGAVVMPDGRLWFLSGRGLTVVDPAVLPTRSTGNGTVRIESVVANEQRFEPSAVQTLPPNVERLQVDFSTLNVSRPEQVRFRYRLEGFDSDWRDGGIFRQATYTNLRPGAYRFDVLATSEMDSAVELTSSWEFSVQPAFYQTPQFAGVLLTLSGLGLWGAWRWRLRQERRRFAEVLAERARISREIHDTLLQSLAGVALQIGDVASDIDHSPDSARHHLLRIRRQVEQYAAEAARTIRNLRSPTLERQGLSEALRDVTTRATDGASVRAEVTILGSPYVLPNSWQHHILRVAQEAVTNSVRHAHASRVNVTLVFEADDVVLRVRDDGAGFDGEATSDGTAHFGIAMMRERVAQMGGRFEITSQSGEGTSIEARIPARVASRKAS
jgi:signal transduction histidine kinase/ligand-binding sensor domain-containing protein